MFGFSAPGDYPLLYNIAAHSGFNEARGASVRRLRIGRHERRTGEDAPRRRLALAALRPRLGRPRAALCQRADETRHPDRMLRRAGLPRPHSRRPALPLVGRLRSGTAHATLSHGGGQGDTERYHTGISGGQLCGEHLQRRHDLLLPPLRRRIPRCQTAALSGPHRPASRTDEHGGLQHAQHALFHRSGDVRTAGSAVQSRRQRGRMVRCGGDTVGYPERRD